MHGSPLLNDLVSYTDLVESQLNPFKDHMASGKLKIDYQLSGGFPSGNICLARLSSLLGTWGASKRGMLMEPTLFYISRACLNLCIGHHYKTTVIYWLGGKSVKSLFNHLLPERTTWHLCRMGNWKLILWSHEGFPTRQYLLCSVPELLQRGNADKIKQFFERSHMRLNLCMVAHNKMTLCHILTGREVS